MEPSPFHGGTVSRPGEELLRTALPVPQEALVPSVVSLPKHRASASTEPSSWQRRPQGAVALKPSRCASCRGAAGMNGLFSGAVEALGPLLAQQFLADLAARWKRGCGAGDMTCLFVFTAAKSLLNKKSDGGVKVGVSPVL